MFSEILKCLREERGITQIELSKRIGVSPQNISYYENGREPNYEILIKIADFFYVSTDYLLGRTPYKNFDDECFAKVHNKELDLEKDYKLSDEVKEISKKTCESIYRINSFYPSDVPTLIYNLIIMIEDNTGFPYAYLGSSINEYNSKKDGSYNTVTIYDFLIQNLLARYTQTLSNINSLAKKIIDITWFKNVY